jgi:hypothetical protein
MWVSFSRHVRIHGLKDTTLDRTDNDSGYSNDNCRWATHFEQSMNTRRNLKFFIGDSVFSSKDLEKISGVRRKIIGSYYHHLLDHGYSKPESLNLTAEHYVNKKRNAFKTKHN